MREFFELLFDWQKLASFGTDVIIYLMMGLVGTGLFVVRLAIALFAGGDAEFDVDVDDVGGSGNAFTFFSLLSILAFFMGAGWMGVACRVDWGLGGFASGLISAGFGFGMMGLASTLMYFTRRLNRNIRYDVNTAVGKTARVYLTIPKKGEGRGQVQVSVSGRRKVMSAISNGAAIDAFTDVLVVETLDDETLVVEPKT